MSERRRLLRLLGLVALATGVASGHPLVPGRDPGRPVLLRGADLHTAAGGLLAGTDLLIDEGRIAAIGKGLAAPEGAEILDLTGRRVYPGIIALQTAAGLSEIGAVRATDDRTERGDVTPEAAAAVAYNPDSEILPTLRSAGITTVQVAPAGTLVRGRTFVVHLDGWTREDAGVKLVEGLVVGWPDLSRSPVRRRRPGPAEEVREAGEEAVRKLRRTFADARAYDAARRADPSLPIDVRWESMRPVFSREMTVYLIANDYRQIVAAIDFARELGLRAVLVGAAEVHLALDRVKASGFPVVLDATSSLPYRVGDDYDARARHAALLHEVGVPFSIAHIAEGPWDARNLPLEAGRAIGWGLSEEAALRAVTLSAAEILGIDGRYGSLEVGKSATLFVTEGDPLDTLGARPSLMWIDGRPVDLDDRHKALWRKYGVRSPIGSFADRE